MQSNQLLPLLKPGPQLDPSLDLLPQDHKGYGNLPLKFELPQLLRELLKELQLSKQLPQDQLLKELLLDHRLLNNSFQEVQSSNNLVQEVQSLNNLEEVQLLNNSLLDLLPRQFQTGINLNLLLKCGQDSTHGLFLLKLNLKLQLLQTTLMIQSQMKKKKKKHQSPLQLEPLNQRTQFKFKSNPQQRKSQLLSLLRISQQLSS